MSWNWHKISELFQRLKQQLVLPRIPAITVSVATLQATCHPERQDGHKVRIIQKRKQRGQAAPVGHIVAWCLRQESTPLMRGGTSRESARVHGIYDDGESCSGKNVKESERLWQALTQSPISQQPFALFVCTDYISSHCQNHVWTLPRYFSSR